MERWKKRAVELLAGIGFLGKKNPAVIEHYPSKTEIMTPEEKILTRPILKKGFTLSPKRLGSLLDALEAEKRANIHSLMVIKGGRVLLDVSHPGYSSDMPHLAHSMSKTLTGLAIGMLWDKGKIELDTPITSFFPEYRPDDKRFYDITVHHLLSMTAGVSFAEIGVATEEDWTDAFFNSSLAFTPGEKFLYNSMNSYILGRIVTIVSGVSLDEFIKKRLIEPLQIKSFFWEKSRQEFSKGGFGVYLSCEAWARIGLMLLNKGLYHGKRIISEEWLKLATYAHGIPPLDTGAFNYGYHIWCARENDEILINGMLGQNVWICPKNDLVVSLNSGNNELFQESPAITIIRAYLGTDISADAPADYRSISILREKEKHFFEGRHWIKPKQKQRGLTYMLGLHNPYPFDESFNSLLGEYIFPENNAQGIMPLFLCVMQSCYLGGIERLLVERVADSLFFTFTEGGASYRFEAGVYGFKATELTIKGEKYLLRTMAQAIEDEDRNPVFKLELIFPELPNSKTIKLSFQLGRLVLRISETPNQRIAESYISKLTSSPKISFFIGLLERKLGDNYIERKLTSVFNPTLYGISTSRIGYEKIIADESALSIQARESSTKYLSAFINRFIAEEENQPKPEKREEGFFKRTLMGLFSNKRQNDNAAELSAEVPTGLPEITGKSGALDSKSNEMLGKADTFNLDIMSEASENSLVAVDAENNSAEELSEENSEELSDGSGE